MNIYEFAEAISRAAESKDDRLTACQVRTVMNALRFPDVLREFGRVVRECEDRARCEASQPAAPPQNAH